MSEDLNKRNGFSFCNEFSVYHESDEVTVAECRFVSMEEAAKTFVRLVNMPAAKIGITKRICITDGGDYTNMEWIYGKGITYPPELVGRELTLPKKPVRAAGEGKE